MVRQLVLLCFLFSISAAITVTINSCTCNEVLTETDCDNYYGRQCEWNPETSKCVDPLAQDCPHLTQYGQSMCHRQYECAWYKNKCQDLGKCSDYEETVDDKCNNINANCITLENGKCGVPTNPKCSERTNDTCAQSSDDDGPCVLYGEPQKCVSMDSCEKGSGNQNYCKYSLLACVWVTNKCQQKTCADITSEGQCRFVLQYGSQKANLCHWVDNKCVDGEENHYTEANCFAESAYGKIWKDGKCQQCEGFGKLLVVGFLAMIML